MQNDYYRGEDFSDVGSTEASPTTERVVRVSNQPHDEEINLTDNESAVDDDDHHLRTVSRSQGVGPAGMSPEMMGGGMPLGMRPSGASDTGSNGVSSLSEPQRVGSGRQGSEHADMERRASGGGAGPPRMVMAMGPPGRGGEDALSEDATSEEDEDRGGMSARVGPEGPSIAYNAADYEHLQVSDEVRDLFQYIGRYRPQTVDIETRLKPFIPDYIPAVGDIDEFLKVNRPDGLPETLGLKVLDECAAKQSDPTVLNLQLRAVSKHSNLQPIVVTSVEQADKNPKRIQQWIGNINELHKSKPPPSVHYSRPMPDIERLMQEWPPEVEELLATLSLPTADLDVDLVTFVRILCTILDIPVYNNPVESLHVMFTLYHEFKSNPLFSNADWEPRS